MSTLIAHFQDTNTSPEDYDLILTGDLGKLGSEILLDLMEHNGYKMKDNYNDCGQMIFNNSQKVSEQSVPPYICICSQPVCPYPVH